jgi:capsular exopolysaccharide synthesis family protein
LVGEREFLEFIQPINSNLDFFAAGTVPSNPSELLLSEKLEELIDMLMQRYDYIIYDTSPIGSVIDANMLIRYSDIVLLVVKANAAEKVYLENFNKLRRDKGIKSAGIILNQVKVEDSYSYGYGDYSYSEKRKS